MIRDLNSETLNYYSKETRLAKGFTFNNATDKGFLRYNV